VLGRNWHTGDLSTSFVPDNILLYLVAARTLACATTEQKPLLVDCLDQVFTKRCAFVEGPLEIPERAQVEIGSNIFVTYFAARIGGGGVFFGFQPIDFLDGRACPFQSG